MKWIFAFNEDSPNFKNYIDQLKVALISNTEKHGLTPTLLYDGKPNDSIRDLEILGAEVIPLASAFKEEIIKETLNSEVPRAASIGCGAFLRCEIPRLSIDLGWTDEHVLYTDCDVMFMPSFRADEMPLPDRYISVAPEGSIDDFDNFNSGVMVMHLPSLIEIDDDFRKQLKSDLPLSTKADWDQFTYKKYFASTRNRLNPVYNWKPYWGENEEAKIVHFHGPKPWIRLEISNGWAPQIMRDLAIGIFYELCEEWDALLSKANKRLESLKQTRSNTSAQ